MGEDTTFTYEIKNPVRLGSGQVDYLPKTYKVYLLQYVDYIENLSLSIFIHFNPTIQDNSKGGTTDWC